MWERLELPAWGNDVVNLDAWLEASEQRLRFDTTKRYSAHFQISDWRFGQRCTKERADDCTVSKTFLAVQTSLKPVPHFMSLNYKDEGLLKNDIIYLCQNNLKSVDWASTSSVCGLHAWTTMRAIPLLPSTCLKVLNLYLFMNKLPNLHNFSPERYVIGTLDRVKAVRQMPAPVFWRNKVLENFFWIRSSDTRLKIYLNANTWIVYLGLSLH